MRPSRTLLARALVVAATTLPVSQAHAEPYAGDFRYLYGQTTVSAAGSTWTLQVLATRPGNAATRAEQALYLDLTRCRKGTCTDVGHWVRPLTAREIAVSEDLSSGRLSTTLFGKPLSVRLTGDTGPFDRLGVYVGGIGIVVGAQPGAAPDAGRERSATGSVAFLGTACPVQDGLTGQQAEIDSVGRETGRTAPPATAPKGLSRAHVGCAPPDED
jgi:hypothetical protein